MDCDVGTKLILLLNYQQMYTEALILSSLCTNSNDPQMFVSKQQSLRKQPYSYGLFHYVETIGSQ